ncbi:MAG TPA: C-terminal binding protein, partial [Synergistales bacterium]|nr:C-terminal binding protein [Synergistales bacterium]
EAFIREGRDCDAMLIVYAPVGAEVIRNLEKCRVMVRTGIGVNNIDLDAASEKGIMVANVPDYCIDEVADHTISLFLCGVRKIAFLNQKVKSGVWNVNEAKPIPRLRGKKYGLLGCGAIGQQVAIRARSFGMDIYGYDPYLSEGTLKELGITKINTLEEFFPTMDFFSLHVPLTEETHHIINSRTLSQMKETAFFVNTSRGPLVNEEDLYEALSGRQIAGAALDVLNTEPPEMPVALSRFENLILTPHAAFVSEDAIPELRRKAAQEIARTLTEGKPRFWVNRRNS